MHILNQYFQPQINPVLWMFFECPLRLCFYYNLVKISNLSCQNCVFKTILSFENVLQVPFHYHYTKLARCSTFYTNYFYFTNSNDFVLSNRVVEETDAFDIHVMKWTLSLTTPTFGYYLFYGLTPQILVFFVHHGTSKLFFILYSKPSELL